MSLLHTRYLLVAVGWIVALLAMPLRGCELNGFLGWRGAVSTGFFVRWIFQLPRTLLREPSAPAAHHLAWLVGILAGFILIAAAPVLVHRVRSARGVIALRCLTPALLLLPLTALAPGGWQLPQPLAGWHVLAAAHGLVAVALLLTPLPARGNAFPIEVKG